MKKIEQLNAFGEFVDVTAPKEEIKRSMDEIYALQNGICLGSKASVRSHSKEYFAKKIGLIQKKIEKHKLIIKDYEAELAEKC